MNKTGGRRKVIIIGGKLIEQLLITFSSPFFGVNLLCDYGLWHLSTMALCLPQELEFQEEARVKGYFLEKLKARNVN